MRAALRELYDANDQCMTSALFRVPSVPKKSVLSPIFTPSYSPPSASAMHDKTCRVIGLYIMVFYTDDVSSRR